MDFKSLQKLRFFLGIVFPVLTREIRFPARVRAWLARHPRLRSRIERLRESRWGAVAGRARENYVTGDFSGDRLDWSVIPPESSGALRAGVLVAGALCLLVPVAMRVPWPPLVQEPITGVAGAPVAGWSVGLWMLAAAVGWASLLIGTATANRAALVPALVLFIYFNLVMAAALPRSWWSGALCLITAAAIVFGEARAVARGVTPRWRSVATGIMAGALAGIVGVAVTPIGAVFKGRVLLVGTLAGIPLGLLLAGAGRWLAQRAKASSTVLPGWWRVDRGIACLAGLHLLFTVSLAVRGGLTVPAQGIQPLAVQFTGYLWPLFYLIGVGVIFKMLRQTKLIHATVRELIPQRILVPLGLLFLAAATAVAWCDTVLLQPETPWPPGFVPAATWVYSVRTALWHQPLWAMTFEWMRWGFLIAFLMAGWAAVRGRLEGRGMAALLFTTILLWLATFEYFFEFSGFAHSPAHTAASLLVFSIFVLWLTHLALRALLTGDSRWWPRPARVALYAAGLLFVMLPVHARAALHDGKLSSEIFLYLFFGIVDLAVPYYLLVYAERRFQRLPLSVLQLLGLFAVGAVFSVPFTILDKVAVSGWSPGAMWSHVSAQVDAILQDQPVEPFAPLLPPGWIVVRGLLAFGVVLAVGLLVGRRRAGREPAPAATMFAVLAVATGLACFANRVLELPLLSPTTVQLITPIHVSRSIDWMLVARYLSFVLPALALGLVLTGTWRRFGRSVVIGAALGCHLLLAWAWPAQEPWLRSTGVLTLAAGAGVVGLLLLVLAVRDRLDRVLLRKETDSGAPVLVRTREWMVAGGIVLVVLGTIAVVRAYERRLVPREYFTPAVRLRLPAIWQAETPAASASPVVLLAPGSGGMPPTLSIGIRSSDTKDLRPVLQELANEGAQQLTGFTMTGLENWHRFRAGALALEFHFERTTNGSTTPVFGTVVVAPVGDSTALVCTLMYALVDRDRRWDLARALPTVAATGGP